MGGPYPELYERQALIQQAVDDEANRFGKTIDQGMERFEALVARHPAVLPGEEVFKLHDTFGFPLDLTRELAQERGLEVDLEGFESAMAGQRARSRTMTGQRWPDVQALPKSAFIGYIEIETETAVAALFRDPYLAFTTNVTGTLNVLEAARRTGVQRVVDMSSIGVLSSIRYQPIDANHPVLLAREGPGSGAYGAAKAGIASFTIEVASCGRFTPAYSCTSTDFAKNLPVLLYVAGLAKSVREGIALAAAAIDKGAAAAVLERFVATSQRLGAAMVAGASPRKRGIRLL